MGLSPTGSRSPLKGTLWPQGDVWSFILFLHDKKKASVWFHLRLWYGLCVCAYPQLWEEKNYLQTYSICFLGI